MVCCILLFLTRVQATSFAACLFDQFQACLMIIFDDDAMCTSESLQGTWEGLPIVAMVIMMQPFFDRFPGIMGHGSWLSMRQGS